MPTQPPPVLGDNLAAYAAWARLTFPHSTLQSHVTHLVEEVAELAAAPSDASEMADVFLLTWFADQAGVNLFAAVRDKMVTNYARVWGPPDEDGISHHVRPWREIVAKRWAALAEVIETEMLVVTIVGVALLIMMSMGWRAIVALETAGIGVALYRTRNRWWRPL